MAGAELRPSPRSISVLSARSCMTLSGILAGFGESFILPLVVVSAYVLYLTDNWLVIGSVPAVAFGLRAIGLLIGAWSIQNAQRRKPWAFAAHVLRTGALALVAWIAWRENVQPDDRLQTFLVTFGVFSFFSGVASSTTTSLARMATDPAGRVRIFALRSVLAAGIGVVGGVIIHELFASESQTTDRMFAFLFIAAAAAMAGSAFLVLLVKERSGQIPRVAVAPGGTPAHSRSLTMFRKFLIVRVLLAATGAADAFLIAFAIREFSLNLDNLGYCVIAFCGAIGAGLLLWSFLGQSVLARSVLQVGAVLKVVPCLIAVTIPYLEESAYYQEHASGGEISRWAIVAAFAAIGFADASIARGGFDFVTSVSTTMAPSFATTTTVVLAPVSLLAVGAGWIVEEWGFDRLFALGLVVAVVALLSTGFLPVTARRRTPTGAGVAGPAPTIRTNRMLLR